MACPTDSQLCLWGVLRKVKGLFSILCLSLCLLAECEGSKKVPGSTVALPKESYKTKVTFDPDTAYPWLVISADGTSVESGETPLDVPNNPERFNSTPCVLGLPGFTSGKHYWEVEYGDQREWAVGVALETVERKKYLKLVSEEGIWQKGRWWLRSMGDGSHTLPSRPGIIGVFLDYEADTVTFYEDGKILRTKAHFNGKKVFSFFYVGGGVRLRTL